MMEVLRYKQITDVLIVVTRYFGGILLGAGGLVRAYSKAASEAAEAAGLVHMRPCSIYEMNIDYARWSMMETLLRKYGSIHADYAEIVCAEVQVQKEEEEAFVNAVIMHSDGRVHPRKKGECYGSFHEGPPTPNNNK